MFIKNIKLKYNNNLIQNYLKTSDYNEIKKIFENTFLEDKNISLQLLKANLFKALEDEKSTTLFPENLIWIKSYFLEDTKILNQFFNFYFDELNFSFTGPRKYSEVMMNLFDHLEIKENITFEEIKNFSYVYQYMLSQLNKDKYVLINSDSVFFESQIHRYFTHYYLSKCYFYVIKNPLLVFSDFKESNPDFDSQIALNYLLNRDGENTIVYNDQKTRFFENNKQGLDTNINSWTNANVVSTFRGIVFKYEDLIRSPKEVFTDAIGHLIQHGVKIKLSYDIIDKFLEFNPEIFQVNTEPPSFSNKDIKLLKRDLGQLSKSLKYQI